MLENFTKKVSVTVGIPAYNEEDNIDKLISNLLGQRTVALDLKKIIVVVDGCTDRTLEIVNSFNDPKIEIIQNIERQGLMAAQNKICLIADTDILVLLDADTLPANTDFLENIIKPIKKDSNVGIVGAATESQPGTKFFETVIATSHNLKQNLYTNLPNINNVYLCHGRARAFSKSMYKNLSWPNDFPEDAYSFFYCLTNGFKFVYSNDAKILFRSPANLADHLKQSLRYINGSKKMKLIFDPTTVELQSKIPLKNLLGSIIYYLIKFPIQTIAYLFIALYSRLIYFLNQQQNHTSYEPAKSSKKI
ncbi:MAG: glycosyltransferase [Patescibacteria group bacterium]|nr:glycosyltransferase [Patescibacteria group bacterium]